VQNINVTTSNVSRNLRVLVVIASFGEKNLAMLKTLIQSYQEMAVAVDVIVTSNSPKDLGPDVEVVVGLPSKNPWSLPFAHKRLFAERVDSYDLFIYSEDDMGVKEENIQAFVDITTHLENSEIAGFLRYEDSPSGLRYLPDLHGPYHWKPESVRRRGPYTIAEFTNEHAGFYILTQVQLRNAIASGGFLRAPYEGRYGMLETAATDPYTSCGFRKVLCISKLEDFLIHHLSNRYVGKLGVSRPALEHQVQTLFQIGAAAHPASTLCEVESKMPRGEWSKTYCEEPIAELLELVPRDAKTILSIGCGSGATELELERRGASLTVLPLDSVVGASGARLGFEVIYGSMDECFSRLGKRTFGCVVITNLIHLQSDPRRLLEQASRFVASGGALVISGPNFYSLPVFLKHAVRDRNYRRLQSFSTSGIQMCGTRELTAHLRGLGLQPRAIRWYDHPENLAFVRRIAPFFGRISARGWMIQAHPFPPTNGASQEN
jgi:SAM-dependent methyltransferase